MGKALFIVCEAYQERGVEKKVRAQAEALRKIGGFTPALFSPVHALDRLWASQYRAVRQARDASLIYYRYASLNWMIHLFLLTKMKKRYLVEINTLNSEELKQERGLKGFLKRLFNSLFEKSLLKQSRAVLVISPQIKEAVLSLSPGSDVRIIDNGYEKKEVIPQVNCDVARRVREWRRKGYLVALFAGSFFPWSGVDRIIKRIEEWPKVSLIMAGSGPELKSLLSKLDASLRERFLYTGPQSEEELAGLYESADFAFSSQALDRIGIREARPLKTREYLAYGLPVVCGYQEKPELVETGLILPPEVTMEELEAVCRQKSKEERTRHILPLLSWDKVYERVGDLFP
ncbi:MAG TPA: glycosyltransferase [Firmicutes bacterium]|nr:glycosyltransferase [Bacillota bacterium]